MFLNTRWNFEPKNPAECEHGSDIDDAFPAAKCCASVDPRSAADRTAVRDSAYLLYVLLLFAPGPLVTLLEGQFSLVGRQAYSAKAGAEYLNRRREDVSDFIPADVVENRTDFGIFERAPQRGINYAAYPATCSAMRAAQLRFSP